MIEAPLIETPGALRRQLNVPLLVLYGVGITVGAGIYVLTGPQLGMRISTHLVVCARDNCYGVQGRAIR